MAEHLYSSQHDDKGNIFKNWEQIIIFSFKSKEEKWEYPGEENKEKGDIKWCLHC